jgi:hypothetical protein
MIPVKSIAHAVRVGGTRPSWRHLNRRDSIAGNNALSEAAQPWYVEMRAFHSTPARGLDCNQFNFDGGQVPIVFAWITYRLCAPSIRDDVAQLVHRDDFGFIIHLLMAGSRTSLIALWPVEITQAKTIQQLRWPP